MCRRVRLRSAGPLALFSAEWFGDTLATEDQHKKLTIPCLINSGEVAFQVPSRLLSIRMIISDGRDAAAPKDEKGFR